MGNKLSFGSSAAGLGVLLTDHPQLRPRQRKGTAIVYTYTDTLREESDLSFRVFLKCVANFEKRLKTSLTCSVLPRRKFSRCN